MSYDKTYKEVKDVFGNEPEEILVNYFEQINRAKPVLDIGSGQGRNSIFLAEKGYQVDAIDTSIVAVDTLNKIAREKGLQIKAHQNGFENFLPQTDFYSGIMVLGLIQILSNDDFSKLKEKLNSWTVKGSLLFITAFGTADPSYERYAANWVSVSKNIFADNKGNYRRFLEPDEILLIFKDYEVVHHWEGLGKEHHHGDGILEQHFMIEAAFRKLR